METNLNIYPITTEKAHILSQTGTYVFRVPIGANRQQIKSAIKDQYGVDIKTIRTLVQFGKSFRVITSSHSYGSRGKKTDFKKAYVTLVDGAKLDIFKEEVEEKPQKETK